MFKENSKAIYLQIADRIGDSILSGEYSAGERLPSVREYAGLVQVNPNTVMRSYELLADDGVIFNKRGVGYFVSDDAVAKVKVQRSAYVLDGELQGIFSQLKLLGITPAELNERYSKWLTNNE